MPPKQAASGDKDFNFIMSVLKNCESIRPDWNRVAAENGLGYGRNMPTKLNGILKKQGLKLEGGKIMEIDSNTAADTVTAATRPATPKTPKAATPKTPKTPMTPKNSKTEEAKDGKNSSGGRKRSAAEMAAGGESGSGENKKEDHDADADAAAAAAVDAHNG